MHFTEYERMNRLEEDHWWFVAKRHFISILLKKHALVPSHQKGDPVYKKARMLDVGCGTGVILSHFKSLGFETSGVDVSDEALKYCRLKGLDNLKKASAESLPFPDNYFDVVTALDLLEHLDDEKYVLKEVHRILKPQGVFIATVPMHKMLWSYHDVAAHHKRRYSKKEILKLVKSHFQNFSVGWIHCSILIPLFIIRKLKQLMNCKTNETDVQEVPHQINACIKKYYFLEYLFYKIFGTLPFGTSLMVFARKSL